MPQLDLPPHLLEQIKGGKAILFLGAGASYGCKSADGAKSALTGPQLGKKLADKFLGGKRAEETLAKIADFATTESSLLDVQLFVRGLFESIEPQAFHLIITQFKWKAIVTTNYDRVIEKAYEQSAARLQDPLVVIHDGDMRAYEESVNAVPILKMHGCISRASDTGAPLVLANEQYAKYRHGRARLVTAFQEWAKDHPVIFCGYNLADPHIVQLLFSIEDGAQDRQFYASIDPKYDSMDQRYWSRFRTNANTATFEQFLEHIDREIPQNQRVLGQLLSGSYGTLSKWLKVGASLSHNLQVVLAGRLKHVSEDMLVEDANAKLFFRGNSDSWAPIKSGFDFPRNITYQILANEGVGGLNARFVLIKGHAGAGKSVLLRRIAWELSGKSKNALCFFCDDSIRGVKDVLQELYEATGERIFIVMDNVLLDKTSINECYAFAKKQSIPLTIIGGVRTNEWNGTKVAGKIIPDEEYSLGDLNAEEAGLLCLLLEEHGCLGQLATEPRDKWVDILLNRHESQLLVTLHEATLGAPLRDILRDEYRNISPPEAQILYLDICSLHRLGVPVRAGLISRMSGTGFTAFQEKFFSPLEKVVSIYSDWRTKDFAYRTRHAEIARIVFEEAFSSPAEKADQIARIVASLNTDYSSDDEVATKLLKGKIIADEFGDRSLAERIFDAAEQTGVDRSFVLQQRALFELNHPGGSSVRALRLIDDAIEAAKPPANPFHHTRAVVLRDLARDSGMDPALADRYRENALAELREHGLVKSSNYGLVTYCEVLIDQITSRIIAAEHSQVPRLSEEAAIRKMTDLEKTLSEGLQRWPEDSYLLGIRAELFNTLSKHPQAVAMLRGAVQRAPANEFLALRLSRQLIESEQPEQIEEALKVLRAAVAQNAASKPLNYQLARLLMRTDEAGNAAEISKLLRRSYTDGDTHFEAQFWCARHEFLYGDRNKAIAIYAQFKARPVPYVDTSERRGIIKGRDGSVKEFEGVVRTLKGDFGFVACQELEDSLFLHCTQYSGGTFSNLRPGDRLTFKVAFSYRGASCVDARAKT
jgi:thioredoxin-like negative regulator of GroEL/cold shock CspA family protein